MARHVKLDVDAPPALLRRSMVPCVVPRRWDEAGLPAYFKPNPSSIMMHYVYLLRSEAAHDQTYVGYTHDLKNRIKVHNQGSSLHTSKYRPWRLVTYLAFSNKSQTLAFEDYLKSHSGKAFAVKRLWSEE